MNIPIHLRNTPNCPPHFYPAETFDHPEFIASIAKWYKPNLFIEYGFGNGNSSSRVYEHCQRIISVDINNNPLTKTIPKLEFFNMNTREFKNVFLDSPNCPIVDMAFIDADHDSNVAFQDFEDLFPHIIENGIIFLHDTFPCDERWLAPGCCNDSYKVPRMIKAKYGNVCDILTIPIQPGLTVVRKETRYLDYLQ